MSRVLIVDDDSLVVSQLMLMLRPFACLQAALSGTEALNLCQAMPPDVVLLDLHLADIEGLDLLKRLRTLPGMAETPVMFITGEKDLQKQVDAFNSGACDWLQKPLQEDLVRARVSAVLTRCALRRSGHELPVGRERPVVMLVDDDHNAITALSRAMAPLDVECLAAASGAEAISLVAANVPDLVLLDVQMPGLDGFDVAHQLMSEPRCADVPIMFVTRYSDMTLETRALDIGAYDFVAKPFSEPVLQARVRNLLRQRMRMAAALRSERDHWRHIGDERVADIVANASDAMLAVNAQGLVVLFNAAAIQLFQMSIAAVMGQPLPGWLAAAVPGEAFAAAHPEGSRSSTPVRVVLRPEHGREINCDLTWTVIGAGEDRLLTVSLRDLTLQVAAEHEARKVVRLEAESRAKTQMMAYLAHEIGNPLNGVLGFAQLLAMDTAEPLSPVQRQRVDQIRDCGELLKRLLVDAMDLARWESGQFDMCLVPVPVSEVLDAALKAAAGQAGLGQTTLATPGGDLDACLLADRQRLTQCVINLLSNAIKYGRRGGRVELIVATDPGEVSLCVSDQGEGLDQDQVQRLFQPYERLGRTGQPGHGLGLVITRTLVQAMGGRLEVHSRVGVGTRFTIVLPRA